MPFKDPQRKKQYDHDRYQRLRMELINALGGVCVEEDCDESNPKNLEVHHIIPFLKRSRPNSKEYFNPVGKELRCKVHHNRPTWKNVKDKTHVRIAISNHHNYYSWYTEHDNIIYLSQLVNEWNIFYCLEHEYIHSVLSNLIGHLTSVNFDSIAEKLYTFIHKVDDGVI